MKIGIEAIGTYLPAHRERNLDVLEKFQIDKTFLEEKIGVIERTVAGKDEQSSDLCVKAFAALEKKTGLKKEEVRALVVVTQNPDFGLPHTSAVVHGKLDLPSSCAAFDISLGCSGFVYGLSVLSSFMEANGLEKGVLLTADPYSKVMDPEDKNTNLLFGDGAAATLLSTKPKLTAGKFTFGTIGKRFESLIVRNGKLSMNGRDIFMFAAQSIPPDVKRVLELNGLSQEEIDLFLFHPGSRYIVDTLSERMDIPKKKLCFDIANYGNTVSSSIPLLLEKFLDAKEVRRILLSGFGVGLSWSSCILNRE